MNRTFSEGVFAHILHLPSFRHKEQCGGAAAQFLMLLLISAHCQPSHYSDTTLMSNAKWLLWLVFSLSEHSWALTHPLAFFQRDRYLNAPGRGMRAIVLPAGKKMPETLTVTCRADPASAIGGTPFEGRHLLQLSFPVWVKSVANDGTITKCFFCYPGAATVETLEGPKTMAELQVGDKVRLKEKRGDVGATHGSFSCAKCKDIQRTQAPMPWYKDNMCC